MKTIRSIKMSDDKNVLIENARIIFRNFEGREGQYNREGDRNFCVLLDPEVADDMAKDGWNVKSLKPRDEEDVEQAYVQVSVNFKGRPPRIVQITSRGRTELGEHEIEILDWVDISNIDLIFRPYEWNVNGKTGIKAYLKSAFITLEEDELDAKYSQIDDAPVVSN
jgi:hypothetical protein